MTRPTRLEERMESDGHAEVVALRTYVEMA
jgi:hypothetical protein